MAQVYGAWQANKIQVGREATAGTAVAAAHIWRGDFATLEDARTRNIVEEQVGLIVNTERSYDSMVMGRLSMPATPLTFEQVVHILEAGVQTVTPSAGPPYDYSYAMSTTNTPNTLKTYTIEAYNTVADDDMREMEYSFVEEFTLAYNGAEAWTMAANWVGRQLTDTTPTSLTTLVSVEEAIGARTKLYIDDTSTGDLATADQITGVIMGASMTVNTGWQIVPVGDGNLYFSGIKSTAPEITFEITMELEETDGTSTVATERAIYESDTVRLFRLEIDGSGTSGMVIDWAGKYDSIGGYTNSDGNTTVTFSGHGVYSSTDSLYWETVVTNGIASLT